LSILTDGGLVALALASAIVLLAVRALAQMRGPLQLALATALLGWITTSLVATVEENRSTWLLIGVIAVAARMALEDPSTLEQCFGGSGGAKRALAQQSGVNSRPEAGTIVAGET
jgi:hypothetical protein